MYATQLVLAFAAAALLPAPQSSSPRGDSDLCDRAVDKAAGALDQIAAALRDPSLPPARAAFLRGCQWWGHGKDGPAAAEFEKASREDPSSAWYHLWLGRVYGTQAQGASPFRQPGLAKRTREHFEKAVELDPDLVDARFGLVQYYSMAPGIMGGSKDKAKVQADEIAKRNPYRGGFAHTGIARQQKDTAAMIRSLESMVTQFPDSTSPYLQLGSILIARKEWPRAWALSEQLIAKRPNYRYAKYWTGVIAAESGERLEEGEKVLREYLTQPPAPNEPSHAAAHWRLGRIREKASDPDAARTHYKEALALDPKFKPAQDALAKLK
jgi:tetratricopeptide (TPR) repeat protein